MIIKPDITRVERLYSKLKENTNKVSKACIPYFILISVALIFILFFIIEIIDGSKKMSIGEVFEILPIIAVVGAIVGFVVKPLVKNLLTKDSVSLISEIKNTGIKIDNELVTGRMLKMDEAVTVKSGTQVVPRKSHDVAFKLSQVSNIEIEDKEIQKNDYSKFCVITVGTDKYYLACLNDNDAIELRRMVLNYIR